MSRLLICLFSLYRLLVQMMKEADTSADIALAKLIFTRQGVHCYNTALNEFLTTFIQLRSLCLLQCILIITTLTFVESLSSPAYPLSMD